MEQIMLRNIFYLGLILLVMGSCQKKRYRDFSLSVKEYQEKGMPDPDSIWTGEDYRQAYVVLREISSTQPHSLPRKGSKKSGPYFKRLISQENIAFLDDDAISLKERAYRIQSFLLIQSDLDDLYTDIYRRNQYYHRELVDLYLFGLSVTQRMLDLSYQINESDDVEAIQIRSVFPTIQYTYLSMLSFILEKQQNASVYGIKDLERLTDSVSNSILENRAWIPTDTRNSLKDQIQVVMDSVSSDHIEKKYHHLLEVL